MTRKNGAFPTLTAAIIAVIAMLTVTARADTQNWTGDGGKGMSITIYAPQATGLMEDQNYLPALVQGEFVSNFSGYSAISVLDWEKLEDIYLKLYSEHHDDNAEARQDLGRLTPTTHFMTGNITKTATGFNLQMRITKTDDKKTVAAYSGTFNFAELDNLTGIRRTSLELLKKVGVSLTAKARQELAATAAENHVSAQTALARGVTAQRQGTEVTALSYYFQAASFNPSLTEAVNRSSILNANITSGSMGENIRNDIQWRKQWVERLTETEHLLDKFNKMNAPYTLFYLDDIEQGEINYRNETVTLSIKTILTSSDTWRQPIERSLQAVYDGLNATGRKKEWQLDNWPRTGVTQLNAYHGLRNKFTVDFELVNSQNKVIGKQTLQASGFWRLYPGNILDLNAENRAIVSFKAVSANDITDKMTIRVANVNGIDAVTAAKKGILQIRAVSIGNSSNGVFTDRRDGKKYRTKQILNRVWMTENLNFKTDNSWCHEDDESNCAKYGRLYHWDAAMRACPAGWRLATSADWEDLVWIADGEKVAGKALKASTGWDRNGNGTDHYGFSALPGSHRDPVGRFGTIGVEAQWWTGTEWSEREAFRRFMGAHGNTRVTGAGAPDVKSYGASVRCVQE